MRAFNAYIYVETYTANSLFCYVKNVLIEKSDKKSSPGADAKIGENLF